MSDDFFRHPPQAIEVLRQLNDLVYEPGHLDAVASWLLDRTGTVPCPRLSQETEDWHAYLLSEGLAEYEVVGIGQAFVEGKGAVEQPSTVLATSALGRLTIQMWDERPTKRRTGRPKKTEKDSATKVIAALTKWHGYCDGSVTNFQPARNRGLTTKEYGLSGNALTRFLADRGGYTVYATACRTKKIGTLLQSWRGELLDRHHSLLSHESGRREDD